MYRFLLIGLMSMGLNMASAPAGADTQARGAVTNLPLPRFVSLRASEGNARRGPDPSHRIDWVYTRRDLPLKVVAEFEHWRKVEDSEGQGGWMHYALLTGTRTAQVQTDMMQLHARADASSPVSALLERGVIARLRECGPDWCRLEVDAARGWAEKRHLWGVFAEEQF